MWPRGQSGNPTGRPAQLREVRVLARQESVEALRALIGCYKEADGTMRQDADPRVVAVAAQAVLTWAFGRPPDYDPAEDRASMSINTDVLTNAERRDLLALLRRGLVVPADDAAEGPVEIEGRAEKPGEAE